MEKRKHGTPKWSLITSSLPYGHIRRVVARTRAFAQTSRGEEHEHELSKGMNGGKRSGDTVVRC
jgi:hypothetical protein